MKNVIPQFGSDPRFLRTRSTFSVYIVQTFAVIFLLLNISFTNAQAPSHDPTAIVRAENGRYWVFTTGDGIWAMSSSNANFTDWRPEPTPFQPGTWPGWINSAVPGFNGAFWAPGITRMNGYYYVYYSCSTFGSSRSAIGVVRTQSLSNPNWTDLGMVISSNGSSGAINAIDAAIFRDDDGRYWMSYGSFFGGLGIVEINPNTGKTIGGVTQIAGGNHQDIEAPYIVRNGNYYYLFANRGRCCNGLNSTYYVQVARSTNIRGPYNGWRTVLGNAGREVGPGHIGYFAAEGKLTYHYYDAQQNGAAKLRVTSLGWSNGWPVIHGTGGGTGSSQTYRLQNRGTGMFLDGMGRTANGDACGQYANTTHPNAEWQLIDTGDGYSQIKNVGTGLFLDGMGRTANGEDCGMWANTPHYNTHWSVQQNGNFVRLQNRNTGLYLDGMGRTANGSALGQYANTSHVNAQWQLVSVSGNNARSVVLSTEAGQINEMVMFPNPANDELNVTIPSFKGSEVIRVLNLMGQEMLQVNATNEYHSVYIGGLASGQYILELKSEKDISFKRFVKQ